MTSLVIVFSFIAASRFQIYTTHDIDTTLFFYSNVTPCLEDQGIQIWHVSFTLSACFNIDKLACLRIGD